MAPSASTHKLYRALGVDPGASVDEIKRAYKRLAMQHHPDRGGEEEQFKEISHAHEVLTDQEQRQRYDAMGDHGFQQGGQGGGGPGGFGGEFQFNMNDIFAQMFGGAGRAHQQQHHQPQGTRTVRPLHIELRDAFTGIERTISIQVLKPCEACLRPCAACRGAGRVTRILQMGPGFQQHVQMACDQCDGEGKRNVPGCATCDSKGKVQVNQTINVKVPRGCANGQEFEFPGIGVSPLDSLVLKVNVRDDASFDRIENDLHYKATIMFVDSVVGTTLTVPWFGGDIQIPTRDWGIINPGRKYMVAGKGMPTSAQGGFGNLVVTFNVTYPSNTLPDEQAGQLEPLLRALN